MRKRTRVSIATFALAATLIGAAGCGGQKEEAAPVQTTQALPKLHAGTRPAYYPSPSAYGGLTANVVDTLRQLKAKHNITRDEYWKNRAGVLANDYFEVWYPAGRLAVTHAMFFFNVLMPARERFAAFFGEPPAEMPVILIPETMEAYTEITGREWWYYADIKGDTLMYQPVYILTKRAIDGYALPHEYYQWAIGRMTQYNAPRWLEEGLASYLCGEGDLLLSQMFEFPERNDDMSPGRIENILQEEKTKRWSRIAYYRSYRMVKNLIDEYGEERVANAVKLLGRGYSLDEAFEDQMSVTYDQALQVATNYTLNLQR